MARAILWTSPRTGSSAFERAIRQLDCVKVLHEPHQNPFYYGPERIFEYLHDDGTPRYEPETTYEAARKKIAALGEECVSNKGHLFIKDFAYYIAGKFPEFFCKESEFVQFKHTFLIRHPVAAAFSFERCRKAHSNDRRFYPEALGVEDVYGIYESVKVLDPNPLVFDAEDLFNYPREMMEKYCQMTGLPYNEDMLTWEPSMVEDWKDCVRYDIWHGDILKSNGFFKHSPRTSLPSITDLESAQQEAVKHALPFYEKLYSVRYVPNGV